MRYRVEELAERSGLSVETVRFYQSRGLLPRPEREGRLAWYGEDHVQRLERVRELKEAGYTLAIVERLLAGELDASEEALAAALAGPLPGETGASEESLTLGELADRTEVSAPLLEALAREGLLVPRETNGEPRYSIADAEAVRAGLALLSAGVPLSELLDLARRHDAAMRATAEHAVELFARFVRDPLRDEAVDAAEYAQRSVAALHDMLPATGVLVAHHFRRLLLESARARIEEAPADGLTGEARQRRPSEHEEAPADGLTEEARQRRPSEHEEAPADGLTEEARQRRPSEHEEAPADGLTEEARQRRPSEHEEAPADGGAADAEAR